MIKDIIKDNNYPIIFIGSGMSKRYLENFPTWMALLEEYWNHLEEDNSIYSFMRSIKLSDQLSELTEFDKNFQVNVKTASYIQKKFDDLFFSAKVEVPGLDEKTAFSKSISPFKYSISQRFSKYEINQEMAEELILYSNFLAKAKVIVTTNYDTFIEDTLNKIEKKPTVYVGQEGFFDESQNWAELFKIHGDVNIPNSIVITDEDYNTYDKNSILISAKILSNLIYSPIIFLGYSLSDRNVQKLLSDFSSQLPSEDLRKNSNRITIVEFDKDQNDISEQIVNIPDLGISYGLIKTNNFGKLFNQISEINQGLTPYEISKYQSEIKNIILTEGQKGKLDSYLISPIDIEKLSESTQKSKIVVAIGNKKNMFVNPSIPDYIEDYFLDDASFLPEISFKVIANEHPQARLPFIKHLKLYDTVPKNFLSSREKRKLESRLNNMGKISYIFDTIPKTNKIEFSSLQDILDYKGGDSKKLEIIAYNICKLDKQEVWDFIKNEVLTTFRNNYNNSTPILSQQRRVLLAYDLLINGDIDT